MNFSEESEMFNRYEFRFNAAFVDSVIAEWESVRSGRDDTDFLGIVFYSFGDGM